MAIASKKVWQIFLLVSCLVVLWFLGQFTLKMFCYLKLSHTAEAHIESLSVKEVASDQFKIVARYRYQVNGHEYKKEHLFTAPIFMNQKGAENHIHQYWDHQVWKVFYSSKNPEYASLQKLFPFKFLFNTCLSLGIAFYFLWLRSYVARMS
jgi:hypothetical protein